MSKAKGNTKSLASRFVRCCFTLNNYTNDDIVQLSKEFDGHKYIIGKEIGEEGTPHLQGYVEFNVKKSFNALKKINDKIHWEKAKGNRDQNITYCGKQEIYHNNFPCDLKTGLILKYYKDVKWYDWQLQIIDIINNDREPRMIHWFHDPVGNVGKSFMCKYILLKYNAVLADGKKDNVNNQVKLWMDANENESPLVVMVDIPRYNQTCINYGLLEQLKNGLIYSGKYEGGICVFDHPHVICLSNELPDEDSMSGDRWRIYNIPSN